MRRAARRDAGEQDIIKALRAEGAFVKQINDEGSFDLLVGYIGRSGKEYTLLMEVKDGTKPPSARRLTPAEEKFHDEWPLANLSIACSVEEALARLRACD